MLFDAPEQSGALQSNTSTTMKIKMLSTQKGSIDGIHLAVYEVGSVHDLSSSKGERELAKAFIGAGMAIEEKAIGAAPENKMLKRAYSRKR